MMGSHSNEKTSGTPAGMSGSGKLAAGKQSNRSVEKQHPNFQRMSGNHGNPNLNRTQQVSHNAT